MRWVYFLEILLLLAAVDGLAVAQTSDEAKPLPTEISNSDLEFFEKSIRPLLVEKCYRCHSTDAKQVQGGLYLDSRQGIDAGGDSGELVTDRNLDESLLIHAVRWDGNASEMPPNEKLSPSQIAALERWVSMGTPDPRDVSLLDAAAGKKASIDIEQGRKWWAFQPVKDHEPPPPSVNLGKLW